MRRYRLPVFAVSVLVVTISITGAIRAQTIEGLTQGNAKVLRYPACLRCPEPSLTRMARTHHVEGVVFLRAMLTERGTAEQIEVVKGLDYGLTDRALAAVRRWRFKPPIGMDGKPVAMRITILVTFGLHKKEGGIGTG
jgi:TonB family protein